MKKTRQETGRGKLSQKKKDLSHFLSTDRKPTLSATNSEKNYSIRQTYVQAAVKNLRKDKMFIHRTKNADRCEKNKNGPTNKVKPPRENGNHQLNTTLEMDVIDSDLVEVIDRIRKELQVPSLSDLLRTFQRTLHIVSREKDILFMRLYF